LISSTSFAIRFTKFSFIRTYLAGKYNEKASGFWLQLLFPNRKIKKFRFPIPGSISGFKTLIHRAFSAFYRSNDTLHQNGLV